MHKKSINDLRENQNSMHNFKKNKNTSSTNIKKKLKIENSTSSKFSKTQLDNFNSRHFTESYANKSSPNKKK